MTTPLLATLLRTSVPSKILTRRLLRTLLRSTSFKEDFQKPSKNWGVPTTPDPNTFAKVSRYKWEVYRDTFRKYRGQGSIHLS